MKCHECGTEVRIEQGFCPRCGTFIGMPAPAPPQSRIKTVLLVSIVLGLLILVVAVPGLVLWKSGLLRQLQRRTRAPRARSVLKQEHVPAKLSELHGEGRVYFVPLGKQAVAPESLVQHYKSKFGLTINLLPALRLEPKTFDRQRKQYIAEELIEQMKRSYPDLAKDPEAFMIGLTDEDIYMRTNDWKFARSYRSARRFAVASTRRMQDADSPNPEQTELRVRQMITKDIAVLYYKLPISADPESVLYQPFTPDGRPDDIWESDVHPEDSTYGLQGDGLCLILTYSYRTGTMRFDPGGLACKLPDNLDSSLETFLIYPKTGTISLYKTDFDLPGKPPIVFRRINYYGDKRSRAFGLGTEHSYDSFLSAKSSRSMQKLKLFYGDTECYCTPEFIRTSPGSGFSPDIVFEGRYEGNYYRSRITWDGGQFVLRLANGETYTYLSCTGNVYCYENGYTDADNNKLIFTRDDTRSLTSLASQSASLAFRYDAKARISEIQDQRGSKVDYEYDDAGYLSKVTTSNGFVTNYEYAPDGRSFNVSATHQRHSKTKVFSAEFDDAHHIAKAAMPDGGIYRFQYGVSGNEVNSTLVIFPNGKKLRIRFDGFSFVAHSEE